MASIKARCRQGRLVGSARDVPPSKPVILPPAEEAEVTMKSTSLRIDNGNSLEQCILAQAIKTTISHRRVTPAFSLYILSITIHHFFCNPASWCCTFQYPPFPNFSIHIWIFTEESHIIVLMLHLSSSLSPISIIAHEIFLC